MVGKLPIKNIFIRDRIEFLMVLLLSAIIIYFTNSLIKLVYFAALMVLFYRSGKNYFWLAVFFTIILDTGGIFHVQTKNIISLGPVPISLILMFSLVSVLKTINKAYKTPPNLFYQPLMIWLLYMGFLMFTGFVLFGNSGGGKTGFRWYYLIANLFLLIPFFFTIPKLLNYRGAISRFSNLVFICVFINILGQSFHLLVGIPIFEYFNSSSIVLSNSFPTDFTEKLIRPTWGSWHNIIAITLAIYYLIESSSPYSKSYLYLIVFLSYFSIFITATRGWFIAFNVFLILIFVTYGLKQTKKISAILILSASLFFLLFTLFSPFRIQVNQAFTRLSTIESIVEGDITLEGTTGRLTTRHAAVMELFYKSPYIGLGFSEEAMEGVDQHVGNQSILMSGGVVGLAIILYLLGYISLVIIKIHRRAKKLSGYNGELLILLFMLASLFVIHSSSTSLFGYGIYVIAYRNMFFITFIFGIFNGLLTEHKFKLNQAHHRKNGRNYNY